MERRLGLASSRSGLIDAPKVKHKDRSRQKTLTFRGTGGEHLTACEEVQWR
jgi:hypothetical protein